MSAERYPLFPGFKASGTSEDAAKKMRETAPRLRHRVLAALRERGPMTADECAEHLGKSPFSVRPRITELACRGQVVKTGARRTNSSGMTATVWQVA